MLLLASASQQLTHQSWFQSLSSNWEPELASVLAFPLVFISFYSQRAETYRPLKVNINIFAYLGLLLWLRW